MTARSLRLLFIVVLGWIALLLFSTYAHATGGGVHVFKAGGTFLRSVGCVATADTTAAVPVFYGASSYDSSGTALTDSISIAVVTLAYDGNVARFRSAYVPPGWEILAVNDNQYSGPLPCGPVAPFRWVTLVVSGSIYCNVNSIANAPVAWFVFGRVHPGQTEMRLVTLPECFSARNQAGNCTGSNYIEPELIDGCLTFDAATDVPVDHWSWGTIKAVYK